jgi:hypothetical protein
MNTKLFKFVVGFLCVAYMVAFIGALISHPSMDTSASVIHTSSYKSAVHNVAYVPYIMGQPVSYDTNCPDARYPRPVESNHGPHMYRHFACGKTVDPAEDQSIDTIITNDTVVPPIVIVPEPVVEKEKCNNGFGNGADKACKQHGNAANQDNTGTHQDGKDMRGKTK